MCEHMCAYNTECFKQYKSEQTECDKKNSRHTVLNYISVYLCPVVCKRADFCIHIMCYCTSYTHIYAYVLASFPAKRSLYVGGYCACRQLCASRMCKTRQRSA